MNEPGFDPDALLSSIWDDQARPLREQLRQDLGRMVAEAAARGFVPNVGSPLVMQFGRCAKHLERVMRASLDEFERRAPETTVTRDYLSAGATARLGELLKREQALTWQQVRVGEGADALASSQSRSQAFSVAESIGSARCKVLGQTLDGRLQQVEGPEKSLDPSSDARPRRVTVFFSWASDFASSTNRGFIEDAMSRALKELDLGEDSELDVALDRDTSGVAGAPDIAQAIFDKIRNAQIFVGDVSLLRGDGVRRCPNPNVLLEMGFAAGLENLGWERIIPILNEATGGPELLPFDVRHRRVLKHRLQENQEKSETRKRLVAAFKSAFEAILADVAREPSNATSARAPSILVGWVREDGGLTANRRVVPAALPTPEQAVRQREVAADDLAVLNERWGEVARLVTRASRRQRGFQEVPASFHEVAAKAYEYNEKLSELLTRVQERPDDFRFGFRLKERALRLGLGVANRGTCIATRISILLRATDDVRFMSAKQVHERTMLLPEPPLQVRRLVEISKDLEAFESQLSGVNKLMDVVDGLDEPFRTFAIPCDRPVLGVDLWAGPASKRVELDDDGIEVCLDELMHHRMWEPTKQEVFLCHCLEAGRRVELQCECLAAELSSPVSSVLTLEASSDPQTRSS